MCQISSDYVVLTVDGGVLEDRRRQRRRTVYRVSDPRALKPRRTTRHALRHATRHPSWARARTHDYGRSVDARFTTIGARRPPRERPRKQIYVFTNEDITPDDGNTARSASAQAQIQPERQGQPGDASGSQSATTRLPYTHDRPFYHRVEPKEESAWAHLRGLEPVTIEGQSPGGKALCLALWQYLCGPPPAVSWHQLHLDHPGTPPVTVVVQC